MGSEQFSRNTFLRSPRCYRKIALTPFLLLALPAAAAYDVNEVALGASEERIKERFPYAHCRALEWPTRAAERRCDDSRIIFGGVDASVTFYLRRDAVEGFDVRFDRRELERVVEFLRQRYGAPAAEGPDPSKAGAARHCWCRAAPSRKSSTKSVRACAAPSRLSPRRRRYRTRRSSGNS